MNLITAETESWHSRSINQRNPHEPPKKPASGLLLGTDFRHAVEFSRSGRAENQSLAGPRLQLVLSCSAPWPGLAVVPGAERKLRGWESGVKRGVGDARHLSATG